MSTRSRKSNKSNKSSPRTPSRTPPRTPPISGTEFFANIEGLFKKFKVTKENDKDKEILTLANLDSGYIRKFIIKKVDETSLFRRRNSQKSVKDENENKAKVKDKKQKKNKKKKNGIRSRLSSGSLSSLKSNYSFKSSSSVSSFASSKRRKGSITSSCSSSGWDFSDDSDDAVEAKNSSMMPAMENEEEDPGVVNPAFVKDEGQEDPRGDETISKRKRGGPEDGRSDGDGSSGGESDSMCSIESNGSPRFNLKMSPRPIRRSQRQDRERYSPTSCRSSFRSHRSSVSSVRKGILKKTNSSTTINMEMNNLSQPETPTENGHHRFTDGDDLSNGDASRYTRSADNIHLTHQRSFNRVKFILDSGRPDNVTGDYDDIKIEKIERGIDRYDRGKLKEEEDTNGLSKSNKKCLFFSAALLVLTMVVILGTFFGSRKKSSTDSRIFIENAIEGRFKITNMKFLEKLYDYESSDFKRMSKALETSMLTAIFNSTFAESTNSSVILRIIKYEQGSIVPLFRMNWFKKDNLHSSVIRRKILLHLDKFGRFGEYKVDKSSLFVSKVEDVCRKTPPLCSHDCRFSKETLRFNCICPDQLILVNQTKCVEKSKNTVIIPPFVYNIISDKDSNAQLLGINPIIINNETVTSPSSPVLPETDGSGVVSPSTIPENKSEEIKTTDTISEDDKSSETPKDNKTPETPSEEKVEPEIISEESQPQEKPHAETKVQDSVKDDEEIDSDSKVKNIPEETTKVENVGNVDQKAENDTKLNGESVVDQALVSPIKEDIFNDTKIGVEEVTEGDNNIGESKQSPSVDSKEKEQGHEIPIDVVPKPDGRPLNEKESPEALNISSTPDLSVKTLTPEASKEATHIESNTTTALPSFSTVETTTTTESPKNSSILLDVHIESSDDEPKTEIEPDDSNSTLAVKVTLPLNSTAGDLNIEDKTNDTSELMVSDGDSEKVVELVVNKSMEVPQDVEASSSTESSTKLTTLHPLNNNQSSSLSHSSKEPKTEKSMTTLEKSLQTVESTTETFTNTSTSTQTIAPAKTISTTPLPISFIETTTKHPLTSIVPPSQLPVEIDIGEGSTTANEITSIQNETQIDTSPSLPVVENASQSPSFNKTTSVTTESSTQSTTRMVVTVPALIIQKLPKENKTAISINLPPEVEQNSTSQTKNTSNTTHKLFITVPATVIEKLTSQSTSEISLQPSSTPMSLQTQFDLGGMIANISDELSASSPSKKTEVDLSEDTIQVVNCSEDEFRCVNSSINPLITCIPKEKQCDSVLDCPDHSDEDQCIENKCMGNYQCWSGECIRREFVCDGIQHCSLDSEKPNEEGVCDTWKCSEDEFRCNAGNGPVCVPQSRRCDGNSDCFNHTDEVGCSTECPRNEFLCPEGWCIPNLWKCDGHPDCFGGEDEQDCACDALDQSRCFVGGCVPSFKLCDGLRHCIDGSDEWGCLRIDDKSNTLEVRSELSRWSTVCEEHWTKRWSDRVCEQLGFGATLQTEMTQMSEKKLSPKVALTPEATNSSQKGRVPLQYFLTHKEECPSDKLVGISCDEPTCGSWAFNGPEVETHSPERLEEPWPSFGLLKLREKESAVSTCAASLISPLWIVTSYSCLLSKKGGLDPVSWAFMIGEASPDVSSQKTQIRYPKQVLFHPGAKKNTSLWEKDAALLLLDSPITLTESVKLICLASEPIQNYDRCKVVRWTQSSMHSGQEIQISQNLPRPNLSLNSCNLRYYGGTLPDSGHLCASFQQENKASCTGKEGSPLMCKTDGKWHLHGLLSLTGNCANFNIPSVFTDLLSIKPWIMNVIGKNPGGLRESQLKEKISSVSKEPSSTTSTPPNSDGSKIQSDTSQITSGTATDSVTVDKNDDKS